MQVDLTAVHGWKAGRQPMHHGHISGDELAMYEREDIIAQVAEIERLQVQSSLFEPFVSTKTEGLGPIIVAHGGRQWTRKNDRAGIASHFTLPVAAAR